MKSTPLHNKGFTVVELIVVVVVIAILASVVIIGWRSWRLDTAKTAVESDLNGIVAAMQSTATWQDGFSSLTSGATVPESILKASKDVKITYYGGTATAYCIDVESTAVTSVKRYVKSVEGKETRGDGTCAAAISAPPVPVVTGVVSGTTVVFSWSTPGGAEGVSAQTSLNGAAWSTVGANGTLSAGSGYSQTQTLRVRTQNAFGDMSSIVTLSRTTASVPTASAQTKKGSPKSGSACTITTCYLYEVVTTNFPAGTYTITCYDTFGAVGGQTIALPANGTTELSCYSGSAGNHYINIATWGAATAVYW